MKELLPERRPVLRDYYMAASVEEAIAYLAAHPGEAQIIGGGTKLMPLLQRGQAMATRLVDVSRISALKRVRIEGEHLVIGGAVTYGQALNKELIAQHMPALLEAAQMVSAAPIRREASLAGSIVHAHGNSEAAVLLLALSAEVEIANLTGSQWVPIRALFVRPGVSRVNSAAEIVTAVRVPLLSAGQGAALAHLEPNPGQRYSSLIVAAALGLTNKETLSSVTLAVGMPTHAPKAWNLRQLATADSGSVAELRQAAADTIIAHVRAAAPTDDAYEPGQVSAIVQQALQRALERARASLT